MDEGKIPKEAIKIIAVIFLLVAIQAILFMRLVETGIFIILGIFVYLISFSVADKIAEKKEIDDALTFNDEWYKTKVILSKEIP